MKNEWKKQEKALYLPKAAPVLVAVPSFKFITVAGRGNPNGAAFAQNIERLYSLAYTIKMLPKTGFVPAGYGDYAVYPLEGLWALDYAPKKGQPIVKDDLVYTIMIRQPAFVTRDVFEIALETATKKKKGTDFSAIKFEDIEDGLCLQMMHVGSFDTEQQSFAKMQDFMQRQNLEQKTFQHREIYISDYRKTAPEKLKTVLRYFVNKPSDS